MPRSKRLPRDQKELEHIRAEIVQRSEQDYSIISERSGWDKGPCWMWKKRDGARDYGRYGQLGEQLANRVSLRVFKKDGALMEEGMIACHHCDRPGCVNPDHLFEGTRQDNVDDMWAKGRKKKGIDYRSEDGKRRQRESITGDLSPTKRPEVAAKISAAVSLALSINPRNPKLIKKIALKQAKSIRRVPLEDYDDICFRRANGESALSIADDYGVVKDTIGHIIRKYQRKLEDLILR